MSKNRLSNEDQIALILSKNIERRHLNAGQQAMLTAIAYPEPAKGGRGKKNPLAAKGFSLASLSQARKVLNLAPDHVPGVVAGNPTLKSAYETALKREQEAKADAERDAADRAAKMAELRSKAPDLADMVSDEKMPLNEAHAAMQERAAPGASPSRRMSAA